VTTRAIAYSRIWRVVAGVLVAVSRGSLLLMAVALVLFDTPLENPLRLLRAVAAASLAPGVAAWLVARAHAVAVTVERGLLTLVLRDQRIEIPCDAIVGVEPWRIPLPTTGVTLRLRSGRRFHYGLHLPDPIALADGLSSAGAPKSVHLATHDPAVAYARSREGRGRRWYHPLLTFVLLALVPTLPLFRLHQWITYGGTFGEYYTYGLQAYLVGFLLYWATVTIYLVLYAAVLRALAETVMLAAAWRVPERIVDVRRFVEWAARVLYFGGVPAFLVRLALQR
jgi:apolipoprotein N-acyltransferase